MRVSLILSMLAASLALAQAQSGVPKFEVASVHQCNDNSTPGGGGGAKGARGGGGAADQSPDRLFYPCLPVRLFINEAYFTFADGKTRGNSDLRLEGGPDWTMTDRYTITAKADRPVSPYMLRGPMLQALLEDRFKLKIRRETRETPLYALTVAKGGAKLKKFEEGSCTIRDTTVYPAPQLQPGQPEFCRNGLMVGSRKVTLESKGETMAEFARRLNASGRPVVDRTGLSGRYEIHLEFAPAEGFVQLPPGVDPPDFSGAPSIFSVLEEIGLKLEPIKGPRDFLVIDHIERPTEN